MQLTLLLPPEAAVLAGARPCALQAPGRSLPTGKRQTPWCQPESQRTGGQPREGPGGQPDVWGPLEVAEWI